jgi:hypothetical protein
MSWCVLVEANESYGGDNTWDLVAKVLSKAEGKRPSPGPRR